MNSISSNVKFATLTKIKNVKEKYVYLGDWNMKLGFGVNGSRLDYRMTIDVGEG